METELKEYIAYLTDIKNASKNTIVSYKRDLEKFMGYMKSQEIQLIGKIKETNVNSYILYLEKKGMSASTVSRNIASIRAYFTYMEKKGKIINNPIDRIKPPQVDKKTPSILSEREVNLLFETPDLSNAKGIRDKAMMELIYASGIKVSELISLKIPQVNLKNSYIYCMDEKGRERIMPIANAVKETLSMYLEHGRMKLLNYQESEYLFTNCQGEPMSRQGFWKMLKKYGTLAQIEAKITPNVLRHSFSAHATHNIRCEKRSRKDYYTFSAMV